MDTIHDHIENSKEDILTLNNSNFLKWLKLKYGFGIDDFFLAHEPRIFEVLKEAFWKDYAKEIEEVYLSKDK